MNTRTLGLLLAVAALAGCNGGTVDRHALKNDSSTLDSIACEGALLAHDMTRGGTTTFFAREQAEELRIQSSNLADALRRRKTAAVIESRVRATSRRAGRLAQDLERLHDHPADRSISAAVGHALKTAGSCP